MEIIGKKWLSSCLITSFIPAAAVVPLKMYLGSGKKRFLSIDWILRWDLVLMG